MTFSEKQEVTKEIRAEVGGLAFGVVIICLVMMAALYCSHTTHQEKLEQLENKIKQLEEGK